MTAKALALPRTPRLAFAVVTCLAFTALLAVSSAQAAQKPSLSTINLCITKSGPDKGSIRFVATKLKCRGGELRVHIVSSAGKQGVLGIEGSSGETGPTGPAGAQGAKGDKGEKGKEGERGDRGFQGLQGPAGTDGTDGRTVLSGPGAPAPSEGADGDFYIDTDTYEIYGPKLAGGWTSGTSLVGEKGEKGDQGNQGPAGPNGATGYARVENTSANGSGSGGNPETASTTATCTGGRKVIGGGVQVNAGPVSASNNPAEITVTQNRATSDTAWSVSGVTDDSGEVGAWSITAYAICANVGA